MIDDLRPLNQLRERIRAARSNTSMYAADDLVSAYISMRSVAREIHLRAGWPAEEFDAAVPVWREDAAAASRIGVLTVSAGPRQLIGRAARVKLLLGELDAWASASMTALADPITTPPSTGRALMERAIALARRSVSERARFHQR